MSQVTYNINGIPATFQTAGSNNSLLQKAFLNVEADTTLDFVRISVFQNSVIKRQFTDAIPASIQANVVELNPLEDGLDPSVRQLNLNIPPTTVRYEFIRNINLPGNFFIKDISTDGTEVRIKSVSVTNTQSVFDTLNSALNSSSYLPTIMVRVAQNSAYQLLNVSLYRGDIVLKLAENVNQAAVVNSTITVEEHIANPVEFVLTSTETLEEKKITYIKGPNFGIELEDQSNVSTEFLDYNELFAYPVTSSLSRISSEINGSGLGINVDYSDFTNFVHFSSAKERLANFRYKVELVQQYELEKAANASITNATSAVSASNIYYDNLIKGILDKLDGYERYLYYESSSITWPKSNNTQPYLNLTSSAAAVDSWYTDLYTSASLYDELNESGLEYTTPEFIRQNDANAPYSLFVNMIGQHFDELWLYAKDITNKYSGDNRLNHGVSKDLIAKTLQSFGVKLYSSNFSTGNLSSLLLGEWYDSGSEQITSFVTASNEPTPDKDVLLETYKRIYHNLPYLIKTKGTERGLRALINCFGIPDTFLQIREFGGVDRDGYPEYLTDELGEFLGTQAYQELVTRQGGPFFGPDYEPVDKIRLANTGSIVSGDTLSKYVSIIKEDTKYTQDDHLLEVGFSPTYYVNEFIQNHITASFNIDNYIGDPRQASSRRYYDLQPIVSSSLGSLERYEVYDFVRLIKFYDNQLFKMIKDFVPARAVTDSGIIIKPHLLERSKYPVPAFEGTRPEYTASIDTAFITASDAGVLSSVSTAYSASILGKEGYVNEIFNTEEAKYTGELKGTEILVTGGELNELNPFKEILQPTATYNTVTQYIGLDTNNYLYGYPISPGNIYILWEEGKGGVYYASYIKLPLAPSTGSVNFENSFRNGVDYITIGGIAYYIEDVNFGTTAVLLRLNSLGTSLGYSPNPALLPITQSNNVVDVMVEPFVVDNITNSDYNALHNNASTIANSAKAKLVDYSSGMLVPHNIEALRNNTAQPATLQEYVYESNGFKSSRYRGKQLNGNAFNYYTPGDISFGKTPVAENKSTFFCYFNEVSDASPVMKEYLDVDLRYLVDDEGTYLDIFPESEEFALLQQTFRDGGKSKISLDNTTYLGYYMASVNGDHKVFKTGRRAQAVVYSHSSSVGPNYTGSIEFGEDRTVSNYEGKYNLSSNQSPTYSNPDTGYVVLYDNQISQGSAGSYNSTTGEYTLGVTSPFDISFNASILFDSLDNKTVFNKKDDVEVIVEYNDGTGWSQLQHNLVDITGDIVLKKPSVGGPAALIGAGVGLGAAAGASAFASTAFLGAATVALGGAAAVGAPVLLVLGAAGLVAGSVIGLGTGALIRPNLVGDPYEFEVGAGSSDNIIDIVALPFYRSTGLPVPLQAGDKVRVRFYSKNGDFELKTNSRLEIIQAIRPVVSWDANYWIAGSHPLTTLVAGGQLVNGSRYLFTVGSVADVYGSKQSSSGSASNDYPAVQLPFVVKPGDQIRFSNDERYTYNIVGVKAPGFIGTYDLQGGGTWSDTGTQLVLTLDPPLIPALTGSNAIQSFVIRTFVNDPKNIIVTGTKPSGSTSGGIIQPEFLTDRTQKTLKRILPNLRKELLG